MKKQKIAITGGFGFIGSSLIKFLNDVNITNIDIYERDNYFEKWGNVKDLKYSNIYNRNINIELDGNLYQSIIHLGAHSQTNLAPNKENYFNNVEYTKELVSCKNFKGNLIFASSASVYGNLNEESFIEQTDNIKPQSFYAFTKLECDKFINKINRSNVYSLRFFNVYGAREKHKLINNMSSPIFKWLNQNISSENPIIIFKDKKLKLERDFIHVSDVCKVIYHCMNSIKNGGIYNVGSGESSKWESVAEKICQFKKTDYSNIVFKDFDIIKNSGYQIYTKANLQKLRNVLKYQDKFSTLDEGIAKTHQEILIY